MKFVDPAEVWPEVVKNREDMMEWRAQPCAYTWKELSKAAEGLDPNKQPLRRKRRPSAEAGFDVRGAQTLLIKTSKLEVYKEKFTEENCKNFERVVKRARQDLDLHKYYLSNTKIIKHYSSVERVKEKIPQFDLIQDWEVETLVQEAIWTTKDWYMTDLYYQYALFLPKCELVVSGNHTAHSLKLEEDPTFIKQKFISEDATFTKNKFHFLTSFKIAYGLGHYFDSVSNLSFWSKEKAIENYIKFISQEREREEEEYEKVMKTRPIGFDTPIHFLVCQERDKGCRIQESLLELTKIRAYFGGFLIMPKGMMSLDLWRRTTYRTLLKDAVQLEEEDPIREVDFEDEEPPMQEVESEEEDPIREVDFEDEEPPMQEVESEEEEPIMQGGRL